MPQSFTAGQRLTAAELNAISPSTWSPVTYASSWGVATGGVASEARLITSQTVVLNLRVSPTASISAGTTTVCTAPSGMWPPNTVSGLWILYNTNTAGMAQITSAGVVNFYNVPALTTSSVLAFNITYGLDM